MKYIALILLVALTAFGQRKLDRKFTQGNWHRIPTTAIPQDRTNVIISITITNGPKQPSIAGLQMYVTYDYDAFPQTVWTPLTNDISNIASDTVDVSVPLEPQQGEKRRYVKGLLHAHRNFDATVEIK